MREAWGEITSETCRGKCSYPFYRGESAQREKEGDSTSK